MLATKRLAGMSIPAINVVFNASWNKLNMASVITVENLSKKYIIGHQKQERYTSLRDVLTKDTKVVIYE